jgi:transcriptional regulator with XRE-family HTH domain
VSLLPVRCLLPTKYGTQPAHQIVFAQGRTIAAVARILRISEVHLKLALSGRIRPNYEVRERLPEFLGVPLEELFTEDALEPPREFLSSRAS